jgi:hypothetical protein
LASSAAGGGSLATAAMASFPFLDSAASASASSASDSASDSCRKLRPEEGDGDFA